MRANSPFATSVVIRNHRRDMRGIPTDSWRPPESAYTSKGVIGRARARRERELQHRWARRRLSFSERLNFRRRPRRKPHLRRGRQLRRSYIKVTASAFKTVDASRAPTMGHSPFKQRLSSQSMPALKLVIRVISFYGANGRLCRQSREVERERPSQ